jgi:hypothetical protein
VKFTLSPDFPGGSIDSVPGILTKSNEQARGVPLAGLTVKVTNGFFLFGLSNADADRVRNIKLLKEQAWFDLPMVYATKRRAILAWRRGRRASAPSTTRSLPGGSRRYPFVCGRHR